MKPDSVETVYPGRWLSVVRERWGGREREIVERPEVVCIVPVDGQGVVTFVRQLREPARREVVELPAGLVEPGEELLACAKRELAEETGLCGGRWHLVGSWWSSPGFCRERVHLFAAEGVEQGAAGPAPGERIEIVRWPLDQIGDRVSELEDAKTIAGLLLYLRHELRGAISTPRESDNRPAD